MKKVNFILTASAVLLLMLLNCDVLRLVGREEYLGIKKDGYDRTYTITENTGSGDNYFKDMAVDRDYIYLAGCDTEISHSDYQMRLEKRYKATGEPVNTFGKNGIVQYNHRTGNSLEREMISKISIDDQYIYLGCIVYYPGNDGLTGIPYWQIQKRDKITGELVRSFGKNGLLKTSPFMTGNSINSIISDDIYLYIAGESMPINIFTLKQSGSERWRIEKIYKFDGAPVSTFAANGTYVFDYSKYSDTIMDMKIDSNFIYAAGFDNYNQDINNGIFLPNRLTTIFHSTNNTDFSNINQKTDYYQWRIEKINKETGVLDTSFGTNGVIRQKFGNAAEKCEKIAIDNSYLYLAGYTSSDIAASNIIRIEKRYLATGEPVESFGTNGAATEVFYNKSNIIGDLTLSNDNFYITGHNGHFVSPNDTGSVIEKRNSFRGGIIREFGNNGLIQGKNNTEMKTCEKIIADGEFIFLACNDASGGYTQWRLEKRFAETGGF